MRDAHLLVGAAAEPLIFAPGVPMSGYAGRSSAATGTHDPLSVRALAVGDGEVDTVVVVADLTTLAPDQALEARAAVAAAAGVPEDGVVVCVTHTHSAPNPDPWITFAPADAAVWAQVRDAIVRAAVAAHTRREPAVASRASGRAPLTANRRNPDGPVDDALDVLRFDRADGSPIAIAFAYACHPTIAGPDGSELSADWPGAARAAVEHAFDGAVAVFLQGFCGDQGPPLPGSGSPVAPAGATPDDALRCGEPVGRAVVALARATEPMPAAVTIRSTTWVWHWSQADALEPPADATRLILDLVPAWRQAISRPRSEVLTASCIRWGDTLLVLATGELFGVLGQAVRASHRDVRVVPVGYANGTAGYLPYPEAARSAPGYEAQLAHVAYGRPGSVPAEFGEHVLREAARGV